jgi:hypothetical protein
MFAKEKSKDCSETSGEIKVEDILIAPGLCWGLRQMNLLSSWVEGFSVMTA